ncbi:hypothetical protein EDD37DRAFT_670662 [Exophiala viscosa]|uniref:uncharacterized protein n=1 Tax=Exophiala viscosa TaxID=2486360 RepID=UPI00218E8430|nr:hypothetical protein EDD37DRAFT_670662 [Exophiala viscosa]
MPMASKRKRLDSTMVVIDRSQAKYLIPRPFLPTEVTELIFSFCDTETLKQVRCCCSTWAYGKVGCSLFDSEITLIAHLYFLERFLYVFRSSPLMSCIRSLYIDLRWSSQFGMLEDWCTREGKAFVGDLRARPDSTYTLRDLVQLYPDSLYVQVFRPRDSMAGTRGDMEQLRSVESRTDHLNSVQSAAFGAVLGLCSSLRVLKINFGTDPGCMPILPAFVALMKTLGVRERGEISSGGRPALERGLLRSIVPALGFVMPSLTELSLLDFIPYLLYQDGDADESVGPIDFVQPRMLLGRVLGGLSHLDLRLSRYAQDTRWQKAKAVVDFLQQQRLPKLRSLRLHSDIGLACNHPTPPLLEDILGRHCRNLQSLTIRNGKLGLIRPPSEDDWDPSGTCWPAMLRRLNPRLSLTELEFGGYLGNAYQADFHVADGDKHGDDCLKARVIRWFLDPRIPANPSPLDMFEIHKFEGDVDDEEACIAATDDSWSLDCPVRGPYRETTAA